MRSRPHGGDRCVAWIETCASRHTSCTHSFADSEKAAMLGKSIFMAMPLITVPYVSAHSPENLPFPVAAASSQRRLGSQPASLFMTTTHVGTSGFPAASELLLEPTLMESSAAPSSPCWDHLREGSNDVEDQWGAWKEQGGSREHSSKTREVMVMGSWCRWRAHYALDALGEGGLHTYP